MPIEKPSKDTIRDIGINTFRSLTGSSFTAKYQQSFIYPFFSALAEMVNLAILYVQRTYLDRWIFSASEEALYERHLPTYKVERIQAAFASGSVTFTGTNGSTIPIDTFLVSLTGLRFKTTASGVISAGVATVTAIAESVGVDYNQAATSELFLEVDIAGIDDSAVVAAGGIIGGRDLEGLESWRYRMRDSIANTFGTGSVSDIQRWITETLGDVRPFVFPRYPANGEITISYVAQDPETIEPETGKLGAAQVAVRDRVEAGVLVSTLDPTAHPLDFTIRISPNELAVQNAIEAGLREYFMLNSSPSLTAFPYAMPVSQIREAISIASGEAKHELVQIAFTGTPITGDSIAVPNGKLAIVGDISWLSY
jgi:uncharacterized phage protein gp47/JayE